MDLAINTYLNFSSYYEQKLAPYGTEGLLFANDVSANFKVT